ncbi:kinase interacting (KIP1-like) family protein [Artemisia annua]|uniref:Kinase interacting (KIP1-like) family protein n=1 Tax=Artemisia annua TaxID=35608 RepID=A0A2U1P0G0_ARTAN|nr:kinase interacting (KIP1-like) family protein [Artemisia annua]
MMHKQLLVLKLRVGPIPLMEMDCLGAVVVDQCSWGNDGAQIGGGGSRSSKDFDNKDDAKRVVLVGRLCVELLQRKWFIVKHTSSTGLAIQTDGIFSCYFNEICRCRWCFMLSKKIYCLKEEPNSLNKNHGSILEQVAFVRLNAESLGWFVKKLLDGNANLKVEWKAERTAKEKIYSRN